MKRIALLTILANPFGYTLPDIQILDSHSMVYINSEHRTKYANVLPFYKKWIGKHRDWNQIHSQLKIFFADRLP